MRKLHVISEKYNDADILHVEEDLATKQEVEQAVGELSDRVPKRYYTTVGVGELSNEFLENLKLGDIIFVVADETVDDDGCYEVVQKNDMYLSLFSISADHLSTYEVYYVKASDTNEWEIDEVINVVLQPNLISGSNIKTINNESILGGGNLRVGKTTLYKHEFVITLTNDTELSFTIITWLETKFSNSILRSFTARVGLEALCISSEDNTEAWGFLPNYIAFSSATSQMAVFEESDGTPTIISNIATISEDVRPL